MTKKISFKKVVIDFAAPNKMLNYTFTYNFELHCFKKKFVFVVFIKSV